MKRTNAPLAALLLVALLALPASSAAAAENERLLVAVTETEIEAITKAVGGEQVQTFSLFKGCILRKDLSVEASVRERLVRADALVWTGFFNESAAVRDAVKGLERPAGAPRPTWIDVSRGVHRINVPTSTCEGYVEAAFMPGNPFFWLNPRNGAIVAANVAEGLGEMRPDRKAYFLGNAEAFKKELEAQISRWQEDLKPLEGLRVFSTQCGWQNFSQIGGPTFIVCKGLPGELPSPGALVDHVNQLRVQVILVDPNTPPEYGRAFREGTKAKVVEVPSSADKVSRGGAYFALFDNLVKVLKENAGR